VGVPCRWAEEHTSGSHVQMGRWAGGSCVQMGRGTHKWESRADGQMGRCESPVDGQRKTGGSHVQIGRGTHRLKYAAG